MEQGGARSGSVKVIGILMALSGGTVTVLCINAGGMGHEVGTCTAGFLMFIVGLFFCCRKKGRHKISK